MNESTMLLNKSRKDYEISVNTFMNYKNKLDIDALDVSLYLMQQAIEKCLKSYLIWCDVPFKRKHDIDYLLTRCPSHLEMIPSIYKYAMEITLWEASTRYCMYELEDINLYYTIAMDYCSLYNFVALKVSSNN